jgi:hypothetical protein
MMLVQECIEKQKKKRIEMKSFFHPNAKIFLEQGQIMLLIHIIPILCLILSSSRH